METTTLFSVLKLYIKDTLHCLRIILFIALKIKHRSQSKVQCFKIWLHIQIPLHIWQNKQVFSYMNKNTQTVATPSQLLGIPFWWSKERVFVCFEIKRLTKQEKGWLILRHENKSLWEMMMMMIIIITVFLSLHSKEGIYTAWCCLLWQGWSSRIFHDTNVHKHHSKSRTHLAYNCLHRYRRECLRARLLLLPRPRSSLPSVLVLDSLSALLLISATNPIF